MSGVSNVETERHWIEFDDEEWLDVPEWFRREAAGVQMGADSEVEGLLKLAALTESVDGDTARFLFNKFC